MAVKKVVEKESMLDHFLVELSAVRMVDWMVHLKVDKLAVWTVVMLDGSQVALSVVMMVVDLDKKSDMAWDSM